MEIVKILERKSVIRFFGIALILSPFFNTFLTILAFPFAQDRWSLRVLWFVTSNRAPVDQLLYIATFIIGVLMLRGAPWAWKCLLVLLGGYILNQTFHFGPNFKANKLSALFFLMNVGIFLFIADQLAWKIKQAIPVPLKKDSALKAKLSHQFVTKTEQMQQGANYAQKRKAQLSSSKKHLIHFLDKGPWATLLEISNDGIRVQCLTVPPKNIESTEIEFSLGANANFRIRYVEKNESIFHFKFQNLSKKDIKAMNDWLQRQAA